MKALAIVGQFVQVRISFIGFNKNTQWIWGRTDASHKLAEVSVAVLTFGVRLTVRW